MEWTSLACWPLRLPDSKRPSSCPFIVYRSLPGNSLSLCSELAVAQQLAAVQHMQQMQPFGPGGIPPFAMPQFPPGFSQGLQGTSQPMPMAAPPTASFGLLQQQAASWLLVVISQ